jgi:hypothetical protein
MANAKSSAAKRLEAATTVEQELADLYRENGGLRPGDVVAWAQANPSSALHGRFEWNDTAAAHQHRLAQARSIITEVEVVYPDRKVRQIYVSLVRTRGRQGYVSLADVMSDEDRRAEYLAQALDELHRVQEKYRDLEELVGVWRALKVAARGSKGRKRNAARVA